MYVLLVDVCYGLIESLWFGVYCMWDIFVYLLKMFGWMIMGNVLLKNLFGLVMIVDYVGKSVWFGLLVFLLFFVFVSISFGVLNLLLIFVLDGGYLLYYVVEVVIGKVVLECW